MNQHHQRRFGFAIPQPDGSFDLGRSTEELEEKFFSEFQEIVQVMADVRPAVIDLMTLEADFDDLIGVEPWIAENLSSLTNPFQEVGVRTIVVLSKAQRAITNFLSSASAIRDRTIRATNQEFGKGSPQSLEIKGFLADEFDRNFAYRVMYSLRNYAQHHDAPLDALPVRSKRIQADRMEVEVEIHLNLWRLADSDQINSKLRTELREMPERVPIMPLAMQYMAAMRGIVSIRLRFETERLVRMVHYARHVMGKLGVPAGAVPVIWEGPEDLVGDNQQKTHLFSLDELEALDQIAGHLADPLSPPLKFSDLLPQMLKS